MNKTFMRTASLRPGRSVFNLSYEKKYTCDMGQLIPIMCEEMVPGDHFTIGNETVVRMQPLIAPIMHEVIVKSYYFFVPYRLLWPKVDASGNDWETFITGGVDGEEAPVLPTWDPGAGGQAIGTLWDFLGFPVGVRPAGRYPLDFPRRAYNMVWNEYFRDQTLQAETALSNVLILNCGWEKDYFTSALPWQQRGTAPALPISGMTSAVWINPGTVGYGTANGVVSVVNHIAENNYFLVDGTGSSGDIGLDNFMTALNDNQVDLSSATTFDVNDLRLAFQIQKYLERNARAGARYTEYLGAHYGVNPRDDRLQRPEFIGGLTAPVIISEVLQTSSTDATTPQGNLAGHGIVANRGFAAKYFAQEFGVVIGLQVVKPRTAYQQGINRQWLRQTRYDFYTPEFANLGEQAIEQVEIFASDVEADNLLLFGYQGRWDEMRYKPAQVCGLMRTDFDYWHLGRIFDTAPLLNADFIKCVPDKRIYAVPSEPGLVVSTGNIIKAVRPMPVQSNPGLIDHS